MKTSLFVWPLVVAGAFLAGIAISAQSNTPQPAGNSLDAVTASPKNHKVLYEDDHIRMLEVIVQPGDTEGLHEHQYPSVFAFDSSQPALKTHRASGENGQFGRNFEVASEAQLPAKARELLAQLHSQLDEQQKDNWANAKPVALAVPAESSGAHQFTNTDTFPHHFYRLEFKRIDGNDIMKKKSY
jgi:hypothetical protein